LLLIRAQRDSIFNPLGKFTAIAQEEEQEIKHHEKARDKVCGRLPEIDGLSCEEFTTLRNDGGEFLPERGSIWDAEAVEQIDSPSGRGSPTR
jgi:hypothetical protein